MVSHERGRECGYDDILEEINIMSPTESASGGISSSGSSYFSSPSDFNSPFGSEIGSTETESEDDDFIAELSQLTRWMAEYTFQEDDEDEFLKSLPPEETAYTNSEARGLSVKLSNTNFNSVYLCNKEGFMNTATSEKANSEAGLPATNLLNSEICSDKVLNDEQMRPVEVYQLKNQPETKTQGFGHGVKRMKEPQNMQNNKGGKSWRKRMLNPPLHPPPATVSPQNGSGMRAVFLGGSSTRNGSSGTGVFLPAGAYRTTEPKKKPAGGCSTVLIPARVLQTLQQHFNNVGAVSQSKGGDFSTNAQWQNDVLTRINELLSQQKERAEFQPRPALARVINHDQEEVKLPQEWTY